MKKNFFKRTVNRMIESRQRQVQKYVNGRLLMLSDQELSVRGLSREQLKQDGVSHLPF